MDYYLSLCSPTGLNSPTPASIPKLSTKEYRTNEERGRADQYEGSAKDGKKMRNTKRIKVNASNSVLHRKMEGERSVDTREKRNQAVTFGAS